MSGCKAPIPQSPDNVASSKLPPDEVVKKVAPLPETASAKRAIMPPTTKPEKIKLTYKYVGNCKCGAEVETLSVDLEKKHVILAFCNSCKKQIRSRPVTKL